MVASRRRWRGRAAVLDRQQLVVGDGADGLGAGQFRAIEYPLRVVDQDAIIPYITDTFAAIDGMD